MRRNNTCQPATGSNAVPSPCRGLRPGSMTLERTSTRRSCMALGRSSSRRPLPTASSRQNPAAASGGVSPNRGKFGAARRAPEGAVSENGQKTSKASDDDSKICLSQEAAGQLECRRRMWRKTWACRCQRSTDGCPPQLEGDTRSAFTAEVNPSPHLPLSIRFGRHDPRVKPIGEPENYCGYCGFTFNQAALKKVDRHAAQRRDSRCALAYGFVRFLKPARQALRSLADWLHGVGKGSKGRHGRVAGDGTAVRDRDRHLTQRWVFR